MRHLIRTAALIGSALVVAALIAERALAASVTSELSTEPCLCDPAVENSQGEPTKFHLEELAGRSQPVFGGALRTEPYSIAPGIEEHQGRTLLEYAYAGLSEGTADMTRMFSISNSHSQSWLAERIGDQVQLNLGSAALPLLGLGLAAFGLLARQRSQEWRIANSED